MGAVANDPGSTAFDVCDGGASNGIDVWINGVWVEVSRIPVVDNKLLTDSDNRLEGTTNKLLSWSTVLPGILWESSNDVGGWNIEIVLL